MAEKGVWGRGKGNCAPCRDELLFVLQPKKIRDKVKVLSIRANGILFSWVP